MMYIEQRIKWSLCEFHSTLLEEVINCFLKIQYVMVCLCILQQLVVIASFSLILSLGTILFPVR